MPNPQGVSWIRRMSVPLTAVATSTVIAPAFIAHQMDGAAASSAGATTRHASGGRPTPMWWSAS
ncbi:hypothetical protein NE236_26375 [Actinoallomurus purpureus]|uniref:hypothetical protein n=1 Tax=Actinoallomurus purpureus TaxID=478114 RepID=UPI0020934D1C|nr:hypothetical protein [Actinoallomurus purpureus]MCO6008506.1 hypothetical protein [Actinoallomurus purpureus]